MAMLVSGVLMTQRVWAQTMVKGTVYDVTQKIPLNAVSVVSKSGPQTVTDSIGNYKIIVNDRDSLYFSYLGKRSPWFAVSDMTNPWAFDVSLRVEAPELPPIYITKNSYREDSLQNRRDYEKIFDYHKPGISTSMNGPESGSAGVGLDLDDLINSFRFRYNNRQKGYQKFFEWEEHEKYVDHRFSKPLIKKLTNITDDQIPAFIKQYRPSYEFMEGTSDADLGVYIVKCKADWDTGHPSTASAMMTTYKTK
jgi:hypothetical protein